MTTGSALPAGLRAHVLHLGACEDCCLVLADPDEAVCGNNPHSLSWSIECPGLEEGGCRTFWECRDCTPEDIRQAEKTYFEDGDDDVVLHGVAHTYVNDFWGVPGKQCWLQTCDGTSEGVLDAREQHSLDIGSHYVFYDEQDGTVTLTPLEPGEVLAQVLLEGAAAACRSTVTA